MLRCLVVAMTGLIVAGAPVAGQGVVDRERIVDVSALREAMKTATAPIADRIAKSDLSGKFDRVNEVLSAPEVDKQELITALKDLRTEMDRFTSDWESTVAAPMWNAQESVASTIDKVRGLLAKGKPGTPSERVQKALATYDQRLTALAKAIKAETDDSRRERLRLVFANVRSLRDIVAKTGSIDLSSARERIYVKVVRALTALEAQLTNATFETERLRIVLANESDFIESYVGVLQGLTDAESLAKMLSALNEDGTGIGDMSSTLDGLSDRMQTLSDEMDSFVGDLADNIEVETDRIDNETSTRALDRKDLDAEIERYANGGAGKDAKPATEQERNGAK